jgi:hypothetical protein
MSKELIEQLAKEHGLIVSISKEFLERNPEFIPARNKWLSQLEAFAKAYQAATPIDNVREALEKAATIALNGCLVPPDGGSPTENEIAMCDDIAKSIRALIPSTQAKKGE